MKTANKYGNWIAGAVLILTALWLVLTVTRVLPLWTSYLHSILPPQIVWLIVFAIPVALALMGLNIRLSWSVRLISFLFLIAGVTLLPLSVNAKPITTLILIAGLYVEEFWIIPMINRKLVS